MKETTKMSRAVSQLEHIYNSLNTDFFGGELPTPIITVQSKPGTFGHCTTTKVWKRKDGGAYELNIAAEVLNYPIEETLDAMLHEMVHLYCRENGIKEVSRGGKYHNKKFKAIAEAHGLICVPCGQYGWNTTPGDNLVEYALSKNGMKSELDAVHCRLCCTLEQWEQLRPEPDSLKGGNGLVAQGNLYVLAVGKASGQPKRLISCVETVSSKWRKCHKTAGDLSPALQLRR